MKDFKKLKIWEKGVELSVKVYHLVSALPDHERYGLSSQMTRCAVSIPANIAEGAGRRTEKDFRNFLYTALGSAFELETLIEVSTELGFLRKKAAKELQEQINHIERQLNAFIQRL